MSNPSNDTGGVRPMVIAGRMARERERMLGMTEEERAYRKRYLQAQILENEPVTPANFYKERYNIIRRVWRAPMNVYERAITPMVGQATARTIRSCTSLTGKIIATIYVGFYYMKYNRNDWTRIGGWRMISGRPAVNPGQKDYPKYNNRTQPNQYNIQGFDKSPI